MNSNATLIITTTYLRIIYYYIIIYYVIRKYLIILIFWYLTYRRTLWFFTEMVLIQTSYIINSVHPEWPASEMLFTGQRTAHVITWGTRCGDRPKLHTLDLLKLLMTMVSLDSGNFRIQNIAMANEKYPWIILLIEIASTIECECVYIIYWLLITGTRILILS